jgi:excisionase family DNA binding protein
MTPPLVYTVEEAAGLLRVGRTSAYEAARRGDLPTVRIGRSLRVPRHALEALLGLENGHGPAETRAAGKTEPLKEVLSCPA